MLTPKHPLLDMVVTRLHIYLALVWPPIRVNTPATSTHMYTIHICMLAGCLLLLHTIRDITE